MIKVPACLACGTCCFSRLEDYVRVTGDDYSRLGERAEGLVWFSSNRVYMRMLDHHCGALTLDKRSHQFFCGTYDTRPQVCRDLARGSRECHGELETKRARPLLAMARLD